MGVRVGDMYTILVLSEIANYLAYVRRVLVTLFECIPYTRLLVFCIWNIEYVHLAHMKLPTSYHI